MHFPSEGRITKFQCRGCGQDEYVLFADKLCPSCHTYGAPTWSRWVALIAAVLLLGYFILR